MNMKYGDEKTKQVEDLNKAMKKFLDNGGKIEVLPPCMTSEEYYSMKKKRAKVLKKRK